MKKKVLLITGVGLALLGAVIAAALNAVFTVTDVEVDYSAVSGEGEALSYDLQERLEERFVGKSTTFLDLGDVSEVVDEFPAFELKSARKDFPRTLTLVISERKEAFAFRRENGLFAVLDETGRYLGDKETNENRRKGENIVFEGFLLQTARPGDMVDGEYFGAAMALANVFLEELDDARANILSIALVRTENPLAGEYFFRMQMREGVCIEIYNPENSIGPKAEAALRKYLSLSEMQRMYGFFDVIDLVDGDFSVSEHHAEPMSGI